MRWGLHMAPWDSRSTTQALESATEAFRIHPLLDARINGASVVSMLAYDCLLAIPGATIQCLTQSSAHGWQVVGAVSFLTPNAWTLAAQCRFFGPITDWFGSVANLVKHCVTPTQCEEQYLQFVRCRTLPPEGCWRSCCCCLKCTQILKATSYEPSRPTIKLYLSKVAGLACAQPRAMLLSHGH